VDRLDSLDHLDDFKRNVYPVQLLQQLRAVAEQYGDEVNRDFVKELSVINCGATFAPLIDISFSPANFLAVSPSPAHGYPLTIRN